MTTARIPVPTTAQERAENPSIYVRMSQVMAEVGAIGKDSVNQQQGFRFRGIDAVMGALHPVLISHGVFFVPEVVDRDRRDFTTKNQTQMEAVHLHVRFTFYGPAGDSVSCSSWGEASDAGDKATGKAMSMALKSALLQTFCVPTEDTEDADGQSVERGAPEDPAETERAKVRAWAEANDQPLSDIATDFATVMGGDIRTADAETLARYLEYLAAPPAATASPADAEPVADPDPAAAAVAEATAQRIRAAALDEKATAKDIAALQVDAAKHRVLAHPVTGRLGGSQTLGELLDDVAQTKGRTAA